MSGIEQFIQSVTSDLGLSGEAARSGTGSLLRLLETRVGSLDFERLVSSMPGAQTLLDQADKPGALAGDLGALGAMFHGSAASPSKANLVATLLSGDLRADQLGPFISKFLDFARSSAGQELVSKILGQIPELGQLPK